MSFERLRMLMCEPYDQDRDDEYIEAIESIENEHERLLACEYFTSHGYWIETWQTKLPTLPIYRYLDLDNSNLTSLEGVVFPEGLQSLWLNHNNLTSLEGAVFPDGLQTLSLHHNNLASLDGVVFPDGLQTLYLNSNNLASLEGAVFPDGLQTLSLHHNNNLASLDGVVFPEHLRHLWLYNSLESLEIDELRKKLPNTTIYA